MFSVNEHSFKNKRTQEMLGDPIKTKHEKITESFYSVTPPSSQSGERKCDISRLGQIKIIQDY